MASDSGNHLYVADKDRNKIHVFDNKGKHIRDLAHGLSTNEITMAYHKQGKQKI